MAPGGFRLPGAFRVRVGEGRFSLRGSMPRSAGSRRPAARVRSTVCCWPSRMTVSVIVVPGCCARTWATRESAPSSGWPSTATMASFACRPALSAGLPGLTVPTTAACALGSVDRDGPVGQRHAEVGVLHACRSLISWLATSFASLAGIAKPRPMLPAWLPCGGAEGGDRRGDADDAAAGVDEGAAAVAGVDRGVGLDRVGHDLLALAAGLARRVLPLGVVLLAGRDGPVQRADDAGRGGARQAERVPDRHDGVTDPDL